MALRSLVTGGLVAALLLLGVDAHAQQSQPQGRGFSEQYPAVLTFENFGGAMYERAKTPGEKAGESTAVGTFTSFLPLNQPLPQLGFHYFVAPPLSVGMGIHYSDRDIYGSTFEIEPRVGVAFPIESGTAFWLRGGITYFNYSFSTLGKETFSGVAPGGEALLVLQPVDHFGFLVGARCLVSVGAKAKVEGISFGSASTPSTTTDFSMLQAGLTVGIMSDF